jgi:hypothetical protein
VLISVLIACALNLFGRSRRIDLAAWGAHFCGNISEEMKRRGEGRNYGSIEPDLTQVHVVDHVREVKRARPELLL